MDHPSGDGPNTFVVSKATKAAGITVALSGLGGDELFAGYPVFQRAQALWDQRWLGSWPKGLRKLAAKPMPYKKDITAYKKAEARRGTILTSFIPTRCRGRYSWNRTLAAGPGPIRPPECRVHYLLDELGPKSRGATPRLGQVSIAEMGTYMQHTLLRDTDQMSMAHALEVRVPFLDHRVVAAALSVSDQDKWPHTPNNC